MTLKVEKLKLDGVTYEVRELPVKILLPLSEKLSAGGPDGQLELIGASVAVDGKLLGTDAGEMGASVYMKLVSKVLSVNGLSGEMGNEN